MFYIFRLLLYILWSYILWSFVFLGKESKVAEVPKPETVLVHKEVREVKATKSEGDNFTFLQ